MEGEQHLRLDGQTGLTEAEGNTAKRRKIKTNKKRKERAG